jgi:hypothetical protein
MNTLEDRLRDAFRADAQTVQPGTIPPAPQRLARRLPVRRAPRRTRTLVPLAAAAAVLALVTGISLAVSQLGGSPLPSPGAAGSSVSPTPNVPTPTGVRPSATPGPLLTPVLAANASRGVPGSTPATGVPRFYVTVGNAQLGGVNYLEVRNTLTGQVTAQIKAPADESFAAIAAPTGDRTFVTAVAANGGCTSQLWQFRLNSAGHPGPLTSLHITVPGIYSTYGDLAITPGGDTIGYATYLCDAEAEVGVIHLATRQVRVWGVDEAPPGLNDEPMTLSLSADGSLLGYATFDGTSVLPTNAPAGSLAARSRLVSGTAIWAALAGDGNALYGCSVSPYVHGRPIPSVGTLTYGLTAITGAPEHVIASWPDMKGPQCYASLDPAGRYLLVQYPTVAHGVDGYFRPAVLDLRTGKLTSINSPEFYGPLDIAW